MDYSRLMERLRLQSIIQRVLRLYGPDECLAIVQEAIEREMPKIQAAKIADKNKNSQKSYK